MCTRRCGTERIERPSCKHRKLGGAAMRECIDHLAVREIEDTTREAIGAALRDARSAWERRHRYMHDLLVESIELTDEPPTFEREPRAEDQRYQLRLAYKASAPEHVDVSIEDPIELVHTLVAARWRLQAARHVLATGSRVWLGMLVGDVEGCWDGSVNWMSSEPDEGD